MLCTKMVERIALDRRSLTLALAAGVGIGMGGEKAYHAWLSAQNAPAAGSRGDQGAIARQRAAIAKLGNLFAHQKGGGLRDAIEVVHDA